MDGCGRRARLHGHSITKILSLAIPIRNPNRTPMTTVTTVRYALPDLLELLN